MTDLQSNISRSL